MIVVSQRGRNRWNIEQDNVTVLDGATQGEAEDKLTELGLDELEVRDLSAITFLTGLAYIDEIRGGGLFPRREL